MVNIKRSLGNFFLKRLAKAQGFIDPVVVLSQVQRFAQPSEVWVPAELLRLGAVLQVRGVINSQAIQHNLDWVWPFWVRRQFDPKDVAFVPRAFSMTHINLTHRNWTAIGIPGFPDYPIVDPRGLVTPFFDGWSLDAWIIGDHFEIIPPEVANDHIVQHMVMSPVLAISTLIKSRAKLHSRAEVVCREGIPVCQVAYRVQSCSPAWLAICPRPYNPEGISLIHKIKIREDKKGWIINGKYEVILSSKPFMYAFSNYIEGDIRLKIPSINTNEYSPEPTEDGVTCSVGLATSVALFKLSPSFTEVLTTVPLTKNPVTTSSWHTSLRRHAKLQIPDERFTMLYDAAIRTLILHAPEEVYPGPFTYKRFWFRDAAFILYAMMTVGLTENVEKVLDHFPEWQKHSGYFKSQDGEWDSNGEAIWIMCQFIKMANVAVKDEWRNSIYKGAKWIAAKRLPVKGTLIHDGLLPPGFSAEHFGPSDYYFWDDFWSVAGLKSAAQIATDVDAELALDFGAEAENLEACVEKSLTSVQKRLRHYGVPASPYRRMDGGAVGTLVASYPLQLWPGDDKRIVATIDFLLHNYFLEGAFYHEINHSGINAYLSLHVAQALLRAGDQRFIDIVESVARLASPTGQWPEAIHPRTKGGCMGDGQHVWASAEWVLMMRNMFVREEVKEEKVVLCSGIPSTWLKSDERLFFGPAQTSFGDISITVEPVNEEVKVSWKACWHEKPKLIEINLEGFDQQIIKDDRCSVLLTSRDVRV